MFASAFFIIEKLHFSLQICFVGHVDLKPECKNTVP